MNASSMVRVAAVVGLVLAPAVNAAQLTATPASASVALNDPHGPLVVIGLAGDGATENFSVEYALDNDRFQIVNVAGVSPMAGTCTLLASPTRVRVETLSATGVFPPGTTPICQVNLGVRAGATAGMTNLVPSGAACFDADGLPQPCPASTVTLQFAASNSATPVVRYSPGPGSFIESLGTVQTINVDVFAGTGGSTTVDQCSATLPATVTGSPAVTVASGDAVGDVDLAIQVRCPQGSPAGLFATCQERTSAGAIRTRRWNFSCFQISLAPVPPLIDPATIQVNDLSANSATIRAVVYTSLRTGTATVELGAAANNVYSSAQTMNLAGSSVGDVVQASFAGLACGTSYRYRVRVNTVGAEARSRPLTFQTAACASGQIGVTLDVVGALAVGDPASFRVATSAMGPLTYSFDFNGDGSVDLVQFDPQVNVTYPSAFTGNAIVSVRGTTGAPTVVTRPIGVAGARLEAGASGAPVQLCGDGDQLTEPGERWRIPVLVRNTGSRAARDARIGFVAASRLQAPGASAEAGLRLDATTIPVSELAPSGTFATQVDVSLSRQASCATTYGLRQFSASDAVGFTAGPPMDIATLTTPPAGQCQIVTTCAATRGAPEPLRQGFYFDPDRAGNGLGAFVVPSQGQAPTFFGAWFTANPGGSPTWYVIQGPVVDDQVVASILRFTRDIGAPTFRATGAAVGTAVVDLVAAERLVLSYALDGRFGSEQMVYLTPGAVPAPNRSGAWFNPSEAGWGQVVHQFVDPANSAHSTFVVHYVYDTAGNPRWVLGQGTTAALQAPLSHLMFRVHCAGCAWTPGVVSGVGAAQLAFASATSGNVGTAFSLPPEFGGGQWNRMGLPITILTQPQ
jgi:hypothetical protein